ncbi:TniQ family protein [Bacillus cereus group sp. TH208-1LC]|uniref:TniQ family protein n=1 Tax=Bacillus cereus group TaxID=86661 RepID=UPI0009375B64|nr:MULTISPECIES: TniQ family protein [Bacillus cereus group]ASI80356.1 hypothetical protein BA202_25000 [Bacillus cereus]MDA1606701.1 TniQ family protein [Bacillus cereus group sp. TH208-1LC]
MIEIFNLVELERKTYTSYPARSEYYDLKPYGLDTLLVESLTSYVRRLAYIHNVTPQCLIKDIISSQKIQDELIKRAFYYAKTINLNGLRPFVRECIQGLEHKTGNRNLHLLTMLSWENILTSTGIFKVQRAWCPECYNEMYDEFQEVYDPLIWFFEQVKMCPKHKKVLLTECSYRDCKSIQKVFNRYSNAYCDKCDRWLGKSNATHKKAQLTQQEKERQDWIIKNIGGLLIVASNIEPPKTDRIFFIVNQSYEKLFQGDKDLFCKCMDLHSITLCTMKNKQTKVHLDSLLKLSYCTGVDLVDLVSTDTINWTDKIVKVPSIHNTSNF